jgi:hypothetical protein
MSVVAVLAMIGSMGTTNITGFRVAGSVSATPAMHACHCRRVCLSWRAINPACLKFGFYAATICSATFLLAFRFC